MGAVAEIRVVKINLSPFFMMEQADLGLYRKEYVDKLISNY